MPDSYETPTAATHSFGAMQRRSELDPGALLDAQSPGSDRLLVACWVLNGTNS